MSPAHDPQLTTRPIRRWPHGHVAGHDDLPVACPPPDRQCPRRTPGGPAGRTLGVGVHRPAGRAAPALGAHRGRRRLIEEDRLDPRERAGTALAKRRWRRANPAPPGRAVPVYLVGLQRSGTNMLTRGLDAAPEVEVRNENDRRGVPPLPAAPRRGADRTPSGAAGTRTCWSSRCATRTGWTSCSTWPGLRAGPGAVGVPGRRRPGPLRGGEVRRRQPAGAAGDRRRHDRRPLAGAAPGRAGPRADRRLRPRPDDPAHGGRPVLVRPQLAVLHRSAWPTAPTRCSARTTRWSPTRPGTRGGCARFLDLPYDPAAATSPAIGPRAHRGSRIDSTAGCGRCCTELTGRLDARGRPTRR